MIWCAPQIFLLPPTQQDATDCNQHFATPATVCGWLPPMHDGLIGLVMGAAAMARVASWSPFFAPMHAGLIRQRHGRRAHARWPDQPASWALHAAFFCLRTLAANDVPPCTPACRCHGGAAMHVGTHVMAAQEGVTSDMWMSANSAHHKNIIIIICRVGGWIRCI